MGPPSCVGRCGPPAGTEAGARNGQVAKPLVQEGSASAQAQARAVVDGVERWQVVRERIFPYSSVGRLISRLGGSNVTAACSGVLVAPNVVLTAAHCVLNRAGQLFRASEFLPAAVAGRAQERTDVVGAWLHTGASGEPSWAQDGTLDWAFLFTREAVGVKYGWLALAGLPAGPPSLVTVAGFAAHAQCDQGQSLCVGYGLLSAEGLDGYHSVPTAAGSSGGPVLLFDGARRAFSLVGIHVGEAAPGAAPARNVALLAPAFADALAHARELAGAASAPDDFAVRGTVCVDHDDCDAFSYCSALTVGGRCFRCDGCDVSRGDEAVPPLGGTCPAKCQAAEAASVGGAVPALAAAALDLDIVGCRVRRLAADAAPAQTNGSSVEWCNAWFCADSQSCKAQLYLQPADSPLAFLPFAGRHIAAAFGDNVIVSSLELSSFQLGDAGSSDQRALARAGDALAISRGYAIGLLTDDAKQLTAIGPVTSRAHMAAIWTAGLAGLGQAAALAAVPPDATRARPAGGAAASSLVILACVAGATWLVLRARHRRTATRGVSATLASPA
jgi:protease YdgD